MSPWGFDRSRSYPELFMTIREKAALPRRDRREERDPRDENVCSLSPARLATLAILAQVAYRRL